MFPRGDFLQCNIPGLSEPPLPTGAIYLIGEFENGTEHPVSRVAGPAHREAFSKLLVPDFAPALVAGS